MKNSIMIKGERKMRTMVKKPNLRKEDITTRKKDINMLMVTTRILITNTNMWRKDPILGERNGPIKMVMMVIMESKNTIKVLMYI